MVLHSKVCTYWTSPSLPAHAVSPSLPQLQSQEEVIGELSRQLKVVSEERSMLQREFSQYRETVQVLLIYIAAWDDCTV